MSCRLLTATLTIAGVLLGGQAVPADESTMPILDRYGDPLPSGALFRLGTKRLQTKGGFAWTPDGKSLVTMKRGTVTYWDIADGRARDTWLVPVGDEQFGHGAQLALSRDGKRLVCTDTMGGIAVWDFARSQLIAKPSLEPGKRGKNFALAILPDGNAFLTLQSTGVLEFRDMATANVRRTIELTSNGWSAFPPLAFSSDGKTLALGNPGTRSIHLISIENLEEVRDPVVIPKAHNGWLYGLSFLADEEFLTVGRNKLEAFADGKPAQRNQIRIWDLKKKEPIAEWPIDQSLPVGFSMCLSPDGKTMAGVFADRILIWDFGKQTINRTIEGLHFRNAMNAQAIIDPSGKYLAVDDHDNYVRVWELETGEPRFENGEFHQGHVVAGAWSPDGKIIATGDGRGDVLLWNAANGETIRKIRGPGWGVWGLQFSADGKELIFCGDAPRRAADGPTGVVGWLDPANGTVLRQDFLKGGNPRCLALSPDRSLLACRTMDFEGFGTGRVDLLDAKAGKKQGTLTAGVGQAWCLGWTADGKNILTAANAGFIRTGIEKDAVVDELSLPHPFIDPRSGETVAGPMSHAAIFQEGTRAITAGRQSEIHSWDLSTKEKQWTIQTAGPPRFITVAGDEKVVACVSGSGNDNKSLQIFDITTQNKLSECDLGREHSQFCAISPDGKKVLIGFADGTALVMDVSKKQ